MQNRVASSKLVSITWRLILAFNGVFLIIFLMMTGLFHFKITQNAQQHAYDKMAIIETYLTNSLAPPMQKADAEAIHYIGHTASQNNEIAFLEINHADNETPIFSFQHTAKTATFSRTKAIRYQRQFVGKLKIGFAITTPSLLETITSSLLFALLPTIFIVLLVNLFLQRLLNQPFLQLSEYIKYSSFQRMMANDLESVKNTENHILCRHGHQPLVAQHHAYLHDDEQQLIGVLSAGEDMTELKQAKETSLRQKAYLDLMLQLSGELINQPLEEVDTFIQRGLEQVAHFVQADRAYIFDYDFNSKTLSNTFEWCAEDITPKHAVKETIMMDLIPEWITPHVQGETIYIADTGELPNGTLRTIVEQQAIKSLLGIPLIHRGDCLGFIGLDAVKQCRTYSNEERRVLSLFAKMLVNVTERRYREDTIKASEARYRSILDTTAEGYWLLDTQQRTLEVNQALCQMLGYRSADIVSRSLLEFTDAQNKAILEQKMTQLLDNHHCQYEVALCRQDGEYIHTLFHATLLRDKQNSPTGCFVFVTDITQRKQAEERQRSNELRLETMLKLSRQACNMDEEIIFRTGLEHAEHLTDSQIAFIHLLSPDEKHIKLGYWSISTLNQCNMVTEQTHPVSKIPIWSNSVKQQCSFMYNDYPQHLKDRGLPKGHPHLTRHMGVPVVNNGVVKIILGVGNKVAPYRDEDLLQLQLIADDLWKIVSRRRTELALEQARSAAEAANRAKNSFLANMSHELRTPLNAVMGYAQLLSNAPELSAKHRRMVDTINDSGVHLLTLLNDILDMSKIEAGRYDIIPTSCDIQRLLRGVTSTFKAHAEQKNLDFQLELSNQMPRLIKVDAKRLQQVLINLLGNAMKFTKQGYVRFSCQYTDETLHFVVHDSGIGISPDRLKHIFKPFSQLDNDYYRSSGNKGTGLGLAISRKLAELMGGCLQVESQVNKGSCFFLDIPIQTLTPPNVASFEQFDTDSEVVPMGYSRPEIDTPFQVLVADDLSENLTHLKQLLQSLGFIVQQVNDDETCLHILNTSQPDIILLDIDTPSLKGIKTTRYIRKLYQDIPIIALSNEAIGDNKQLLDIGCNDNLIKPIQNVQLYVCLQQNLALEWQYAASPSTHQATTTTVSTLTKTQRDTLIQLIDKGAISKVSAFLKELKTSPDTATEAEQLLGFVRNINLKGLKARLM